MHEFNIFYSFWFFVLHTVLSSFSLSLPHSLLLSLWPSQNSNEIKWSLICMHLQNIACAVFAIKGMEKRVVVVLVGVYVLPHWHQTVLWYGNGRAREEWLLTEALFGCRPRSIPPSLYLSSSIPLFLSQSPSYFVSYHHLQPFFYFLPLFVPLLFPLCLLLSFSVCLAISYIV